MLKGSNRYSVIEKTDVWSFGVIAWELFTKEQPFAGMNPFGVMYGVASYTLKLHVPNSVRLPYRVTGHHIAVMRAPTPVPD